jgi:uncharacterized membrane protein
MLRHLLGFPGVAVLQNLHPLMVHFPIAFLTGATALYLGAAITRREPWAWVALWMLALGALGATAAVRTGLAAGQSVMVAPAVRARVLLQHEHMMLTAWVLSLALLVWAILAPPMPKRGALIFLALLLVMAGVLTKGADYGGWMVFGYNAGGSLPQPIEFSS